MSTLTDYTPIDRLIDYLEGYIKDCNQQEPTADPEWDAWDYGHLTGLQDALATAMDFRDRYGQNG